jgi:hypothetical protein
MDEGEAYWKEVQAVSEQVRLRALEVSYFAAAMDSTRSWWTLLTTSKQLLEIFHQHRDLQDLHPLWGDEAREAFGLPEIGC